MFLYLAGETIGYVGRVLSVSNIAGYSLESTGDYIIQFTLLTICPNFFNAAIYSQYGRFLYAYGTSETKIQEINVFGKKFQPTIMSFILIFIDFACIFIQAAGGNILRAAKTQQTLNIGNGVYIAGIALQCFSMSCFTLLFSKLMYNIHVKSRLLFARNKDTFELYGGDLQTTSLNGTYFCPWKWASIINSVSLEEVYRYEEKSQPTTIPLEEMSTTQRKMFKYYPFILTIAFILAIIRCFYRLFEVAIGGWNGYLMSHEIFLIVLDFIPLSIGALLTCIFSEGFVFGKQGIKILKQTKLDHYQGKSSRKRLAYDIKTMFGKS
ncbi:hypothetical protein QEN19_003011 [Hanseniaspora menglaensis]